MTVFSSGRAAVPSGRERVSSWIVGADRSGVCAPARSISNASVDTAGRATPSPSSPVLLGRPEMRLLPRAMRPVAPTESAAVRTTARMFASMLLLADCWVGNGLCSGPVGGQVVAPPPAGEPRGCAGRPAGLNSTAGGVRSSGQLPEHAGITKPVGERAAPEAETSSGAGPVAGPVRTAPSRARRRGRQRSAGAGARRTDR